MDFREGFLRRTSSLNYWSNLKAKQPNNVTEPSVFPNIAVTGSFELVSESVCTAKKKSYDINVCILRIACV